MTHLTLGVADERRETVVTTVLDGIRAFNEHAAGPGASRPLSSLAWQGDELVGGVIGRTVYGHFLIEMVWIHERLRRCGLGRCLMHAAEREAIARGCRAAQVDTLSFQGVEFYTALGFEEIGRVDDFPPGCSKHYFVRRYGHAS